MSQSPWLVYNHSVVLKKRLLPLCHPRTSLSSDWALKVVRQVVRSVSLHEISHCLLLLLCSCFAQHPSRCHCSNRKIGLVVQKQRLALFFALLQHSRASFPLDTDIILSNLLLYPENIAHHCVAFVVLLPIDPSSMSPFLQHPIQCCPDQNRRFRLRSAILNLSQRFLYIKFPWDKHEFTRLAHWLDHWPKFSNLS